MRKGVIVQNQSFEKKHCLCFVPLVQTFFTTLFFSESQVFSPSNAHIWKTVGIARGHSRVMSTLSSGRGTPSLLWRRQTGSGDWKEASTDACELKSHFWNFVHLWWCLGHCYFLSVSACIYGFMFLFFMIKGIWSKPTKPVLLEVKVHISFCYNI